MPNTDRYILRKDLAQEMFEWVFFSGVSDKRYGFSKVTDGKLSYYEVPFISKSIRGFITVDTPRSIMLMAKRCDGKEFHKEFKTAYDAKLYLTNHCMPL
jgi:hypothetical protein